MDTITAILIAIMVLLFGAGIYYTVATDFYYIDLDGNEGIGKGCSQRYMNCYKKDGGGRILVKEFRRVEP